MKKIYFLVAFALICIADTNAQIYMVGGIDNAGISVKQNNDLSFHTNSGYAWQAGITTLFPVEHNEFLYAGLLYETKKLDWHYWSCCSFAIDETDHTHYITLPVGGGVRVFPKGKVDLAFTGGAYISYAVGGEANGVWAAGDIVVPVPQSYTKKLKFGNADDDDLLRWNYGLQAGAMLSWKKIAVRFNYNYGLGDISPNQSLMSGLYKNARYRSFSLDLAYRLRNLSK